MNRRSWKWWQHPSRHGSIAVRFLCRMQLDLHFSIFSSHNRPCSCISLLQDLAYAFSPHQLVYYRTLMQHQRPHQMHPPPISGRASLDHHLCTNLLGIPSHRIVLLDLNPVSWWSRSHLYIHPTNLNRTKRKKFGIRWISDNKEKWTQSAMYLLFGQLSRHRGRNLCIVACHFVDRW